MHGGALGGVPGEGVGEIGRLIAGVAEGPVGEPPLPGRPIRLEEAAGHNAVAGDGLDPQDVPVGQAPAWLSGLDAVVVAAADDHVSY